jgi:hypothetical protein
MDCRGPGFLAVVWFGSFPFLSPSPVGKLDRRLTGRLRKRDNFAKGWRGKGPNRYGEKAWYCDDRCLFCLHSGKPRNNAIEEGRGEWWFWTGQKTSILLPPMVSLEPPWKNASTDTAYVTIRRSCDRQDYIEHTYCRNVGQRRRSIVVSGSRPSWRVRRSWRVLGVHLQILHHHKNVKTYSDSSAYSIYQGLSSERAFLARWSL